MTEGLPHSREVCRELLSLCGWKPPAARWILSAQWWTRKDIVTRSVLWIAWSLGWQTERASPGQVPDTATGQRKLCALYQVDLQCPAGEIIVIFTWKTICDWLWASILKNGVEGPDFSFRHCLSIDVESGQDLSSQPFQGERQRSVITTEGL